MSKNKAMRFDEKTKKMVAGNLRHARGFRGEQDIAFWLGDNGYLIVDGPSGAAGHAINAHGFDGVAFNPGTGDLIIYDNKSLVREGNAASASAIEKNLEKNLGEQIDRIEKSVKAGNNFPHHKKVLGKLKAAKEAITSGKAWPKGVQIHLYNAGGKNVTGVTERLALKGIKFVDYYAAERIRWPLQFNPKMKALRESLRRSAVEAEEKAGVKLTEKAIQGLERKIAKTAEKKGVDFARKKLPKFIARAVIKQSAKQAAKRAASLMPVIGWGFAADDIYKGAQDVMRGNVGRGLSGVGIAIGDVASDLLHLGDAVTGVGGTALSIGVQGGAIAGQIAIEVDRFKEKMEELGEEIARDDKLPPDSRLRDYYDLDDEMIDELRREFAAPIGQGMDHGPIFADPPPEPLGLPPEFCPAFRYFQPVPPPPEVPKPHLRPGQQRSQPGQQNPPPRPVVPKDLPVA